MDFTLENWEQLGQGQGDLFWDTALDNYQNLFLLNPPQTQPDLPSRWWGKAGGPCERKPRVNRC